MRYRLPVELELAILEFAAPPLAIDSLHDRVEFFIKVSLVHRSFTAWAQERLHDQFLYTYHPQPDEHERLKMRFAAGFGRGRPLLRLYLDLTELPALEELEEPCRYSVSVTVEGHDIQPTSLLSASSDPRQVGTRAEEEANEAVATFVYGPQDDGWQVCPMIASYSQALDTLWVKHPHSYLDIKNLPPPRLLYIDSTMYDNQWGWFGLLPLSSETVLFLRNTSLRTDHTEGSTGGYATRHMIFYGCWTEASWSSFYDVLSQFHHLETLVFLLTDLVEFKTDLASVLIALPPSLRHVHILEHEFNIADGRSNAPHVLPHLESFTYTLLSSSETPADEGNDGPGANKLAEVQQAVASSIVAPNCTFEFLRSTRSPEDAVADALAALKLEL